jgi:polysaccharide export outer membrane protein
MRRSYFLTMVAVCLAASSALAAQRNMQQTSFAPQDFCANSTPGGYALRLSDVVDLKFPFAPDYDETVTVQPDGAISLRESKPVPVAGKTLHDAEVAIEAAYVGVLKQPKVSIVMKDFQKPSFYVSGEVVKPGQYELRESLTLLQAISVAGGINNDRAKKKQIIVLRPQCNGFYLTMKFDIKSVLYGKAHDDSYKEGFVKPGDIIFVPQNTYTKIEKYLPSTNVGAYAQTNPLTF